MVLLLDKNFNAGCLFRPNFQKQVVIEIQKMAHPRQKFSKYPPGLGHMSINVIIQFYDRILSVSFKL